MGSKARTSSVFQGGRTRYYREKTEPAPAEVEGATFTVRLTICVSNSNNLRLERLRYALRRQGVSASKSGLLAEGIQFVEKKYQKYLDEVNAAAADAPVQLAAGASR